jgi:hypothetical protein
VRYLITIKEKHINCTCSYAPHHENISRVELKFQAFLTSELGGGKWFVSCFRNMEECK